MGQRDIVIERCLERGREKRAREKRLVRESARERKGKRETRTEREKAKEKKGEREKGAERERAWERKGQKKSQREGAIERRPGKSQGDGKRKNNQAIFCAFVFSCLPLRCAGKDEEKKGITTITVANIIHGSN